jgi:hypothetical protein
LNKFISILNNKGAKDSAKIFVQFFLNNFALSPNHLILPCHVPVPLSPILAEQTGNKSGMRASGIIYDNPLIERYATQIR